LCAAVDRQSVLCCKQLYCSVDLVLQNACKILNLPTLSKDKFGQVRRRWEDDIITSLLETRYKDLVWIHMAYVRDILSGSCENCHELLRSWFRAS